MGMFDDFDFDGLRHIVGDFDEDLLMEVGNLWAEIADLLPDDESPSINDAVTDSFEALGLPMKEMMVMGLKLAVQKNERPMEFSANFVSGYTLGFIHALARAGDDPLGQMRKYIAEHLPAKPKRKKKPRNALQQGWMATGAQDGPISLKKTTAMLREKAVEIGERFERFDDDWSPVMFVVTSEMAAFVGMDGIDEGARDQVFGSVLPEIIGENLSGDVLVVALVMSTWALEDGAAWMEAGNKIVDHEDRVEKLLIYAANNEGESEMWQAKIERHFEDPPSLSEWTLADMDWPPDGRIPQMVRKLFVQ